MAKEVVLILASFSIVLGMIFSMLVILIGISAHLKEIARQQRKQNELIRESLYGRSFRSTSAVLRRKSSVR